VSGSRINEQKTEILKIGNPDTLNHPHIHQLVKDKVKVLGIWFGKDHINTIKITTPEYSIYVSVDNLYVFC
jgi:hypothetical protein